MNRSGAVRAWVWAAAMAAGRAAAAQESAPPAAHFHHLHLNVLDVQASVDFYVGIMGGVAVSYRGLAPAVFTERSFIFFNRVDSPAPAALETTIYHIGWGAVDGYGLFNWLKTKGIEFHTEVTPLGDEQYIYFYGPDREMIEFWTGYKNHRYGHVHFFSDDIDAATAWFEGRLGLKPAIPRAFPIGIAEGVFMNRIQADNVDLVFFNSPREEKMKRFFPEAPIPPLVPTEGHVVDHLAFSYRQIDPVFERMKAAGVQIVAPIGAEPAYGLRRFLIRGPDGLLVEIVEEKPIPDGIWE